MVCLVIKIPQYFDPVILNYTCRFVIIPLNLANQAKLLAQFQVYNSCNIIMPIFVLFLDQLFALCSQVSDYSDTYWLSIFFLIQFVLRACFCAANIEHPLFLSSDNLSYFIPMSRYFKLLLFLLQIYHGGVSLSIACVFLPFYFF